MSPISAYSFARLLRTLPEAANTDTELTALEAAQRMGWRGIVEAEAETVATGIGATLWGILRMGSPLLTLGFAGDSSPKPPRLGDFQRPKPDPQFEAETDLDFLKQQKTLAELSGNDQLATILDVRIRTIEFQLAMARAPQRRTPFQGGPIQILNSAGGNSMPVHKTPVVDPKDLSEENRATLGELEVRVKTSERTTFQLLLDKNVSPDNPLLDTFVARHPQNESAAHIVTWYRMSRIMDNKLYYGSMFQQAIRFSPDNIAKDVPSNHIPWLWDTILSTVSRGRNASTRRYALLLTQHIMSLSNRQVDTFHTIMEAGLQDPDPLNVWLTWKIYHHYFPEEAHTVNERDLIEPVQLTVGSSPQFGLERYLHGTQAQILMRHEIFMTILGNCEIEVSLLSWRQFQPIHSLADFNPDVGERETIVQKKQALLLKLAQKFHWDPELTLHEFLIGDPLSNMDAAKVIVLPSGKSYLAQGHHRIAALIDLAQRGEIPIDWLNQIPVYVMRYDGDVPEVIVHRVLTLGIDLMWSDLFPPATF